jgi:hypothetical protein
LRGYGKAPLSYAEFTICREFGWTFTELEEQPAERIEQAFLFIERENLYRKQQEDM